MVRPLPRRGIPHDRAAAVPAWRGPDLRSTRTERRADSPPPPESRCRKLPDVLAPALRIVFVGINPSLASGRAGHHFAGPGNPFWRLLHASGLTPELLRPQDDGRLVELGLGVTNVCSRPTRSAAELTRGEYERGARALVRKLEAIGPEMVALVGVTLARIVLPGSPEVGPGPRAASIAGARVFVLPNPSGRNAAYPSFESKRAWFVRLKEATRGQSRRVTERVVPLLAAPGGRTPPA